MVQGSAAEAKDDGSEGRLYAGTYCGACGGWHIVNPKTGRLLSDDAQGRSERANPRRRIKQRATA
jgi:hypothetical protein